MIADRDQRQQAVMTPDHAFVWASAGTGKTHTLTLRALFLLLTAPFQKRAVRTDCTLLYTAPNRVDRLQAARAVLRRVVLTTFTRKASAEMLTRLYEYLDRIASAPNVDALRAEVAKLNSGHGDEQFVEVVEHVLDQVGDFDKLRAGAEALAELATELQVYTLHSLAAAILRRHPIAAGIPPTAQFAEEDDTTAMDPAEQVVDRWWQHALGDDKLRRQLEVLLEALPLQDLRAWLVAIVGKPWIVTEMNLGKPDKRALAEIIEATNLLVAGLEGARSNWTAIIDTRETLRNTLLKVQDSQKGAWKEFCAVLCGQAGVVFDAKSKFLQDAVAGLGKLARYYQSFEMTYIPALQQCLATDLSGLWKQWTEFTKSFADWADGAVVRELNLVTFDDMVNRATQLLATNADVRREERERLWALLVDEFQDTDPVQLELLQHLVGRQSRSDHEVIGFFVGDPKQSIYRFRYADLPAIQSFVDGYHKLTAVDKNRVRAFRLTTSFRSLKPILDFVNDFFENRVPLPDYAKEKLSPLRQEKGEIVEWRLLAETPETKQAAAKRTQAAQATAQLIGEYVKKTGTGNAAYSDIVVLVNTHAELDALLPALQEAGIPAVSSGAKTFYQKPEVLDVLNLLIALHNPQDTLAIGALLRSPLIGLSDMQIYGLQREIKTRELFFTAVPLPVDAPIAAQERIQTIRLLVADRTKLAQAEWLRRVRAFIPNSVYAQQDSEGRAVVRVDSVLGAFRRMAELGTLPPLVWLLEQRARVDKVDNHDAEMGEDISITDESVAAVRVLTIHKAKGLQGRFVIVYGWQKALGRRNERAKSKDIVSVTKKGGQSIAGFRLRWGDLDIVTPRYAEAMAADRQLEAEEGVRLAYVAATRAKDRLVLLSHDLDDLAGEILAEAATPIAGGSKSAAIWGGAALVKVIEPEAGIASAPPDVRRISDGKGYARLWQDRMARLAQPQVPLLHKPSQPEHPLEQDEVEVSDYVKRKLDAARQVGMECGTVVHRYLECHLQDETFEPAKYEKILEAEFPQGVKAKADSKARKVLGQFFGSALHDRSRAGRVVGREIPVYLTHDGKPWSGVIDLVLEEKNGTILGVDYKTMAKPASLPEEYAQQERVYTEALRRLIPTGKIGFEFWWLA